MSISINNIEFVWNNIKHPLLFDGDLPKLYQKLDKELNSWYLTKYIPGQSVKQVGVDCVRFVFSVINYMYGYDRGPLAKLPQDTAFHAPETARAALRELIRIYNAAFIDGLNIEPGDVIITGTSDGGPGHAMIAGIKKNELWHCSPSGVEKTGPGFGTNSMFNFYKILRSKDKYLWI